MKLTSKLWIGIGVLALFAPLGIVVPEFFKSGSAWGEWGVEEMQKLVGYIPKGLERFSNFWKAPLPDYISHSWFGYIFSAVIGIMAVVILIFLLGKLLTNKDEK